jgi:hypothetical protein
MGLVAVGLNQMLDALDETPAAPAAGIGYLSLHTNVVGSGDTGEVTGGAPAYARKAVTWNAAAAGSKAISGTPVFDVPSGTTITRVGLYSAITAGTYFGDAEITDETYGGQGTYTVTAATISVT